MAHRYHCRPEPALGRPRIRLRPYCVLSIVSCVSVLCRAELWIYWSDFNDTLGTVYGYGLVVHHKVC